MAYRICHGGGSETSHESLPLARLLGEQRRQRSLSLAEVARRMRRAAEADRSCCCVTRQTIHAYEHGRIPHPDALRWLAAALEAPLDRLCSAAEWQRVVRRLPADVLPGLLADAGLEVLDSNPGQAPSRTVEIPIERLELHGSDSALLGWPEFARSGHDVRRRELFGLLPAGIAAMLSPPRLRSLEAAEPALSVHTSIIESVKAIATQYRQLWATTPPAQLTSQVSGHLRLVSWLLDSTGSRSERSRLAAAGAEAALMLAWLASDMSDHTITRNHYQAAIEYAEQAGDDLLQAYIVGEMGFWAAGIEEGEEAVLLTERAESLLPENSPPAGRVVIASSKGVAYAMISHPQAALEAFGQAERALQAQRDGEATLPWVFPGDHGRIARFRGMAAIRLGRPREGLAALEEGLEILGSAPTKRRARILTELARGHVLAADIDRACSLAAEALGLGTQLGSPRMVRYVREVRAQLEP
ncbi:MAG: helix-turn-helix domain-containing protein, partial [Actinomycetota bacterium]